LIRANITCGVGTFDHSADILRKPAVAVIDHSTVRIHRNAVGERNVDHRSAEDIVASYMPRVHVFELCYATCPSRARQNHRCGESDRNGNKGHKDGPPALIEWIQFVFSCWRLQVSEASRLVFPGTDEPATGLIYRIGSGIRASTSDLHTR